MRSVTATTFRYELRRAAAAGVIETAATTFLLLIAVRHFHAGPYAKALVVAGGSLGLLLTPLTVSLVGRRRWTVTTGASRIAMAAACGFASAAAFPAFPAFLAGAVAGMACVMTMVPLLTQMYQENYPVEERGRRYSTAVPVRIVSAAAFSFAAGWWLSGSLDRYPGVLASFAAAAAYSSWCLRRIPSPRLSPETAGHPFRAARFVRDDAPFRLLLGSWMLMGIGNLMMLPLRVEVLANPRYGFAYAASTIALITGVIPSLSRLVTTLVWGRAFDRMNFFLMRATLNVGFGTAIACFFNGGTFFWFAVSAVFFGIANAGGDVAWSLWVTKIAPPARVADYMSVHTFLTGLRAAASPFAAFIFIEHLPVRVLSWISVGLIVIASSLLVPSFGWRPRRAARAAPPAPDVPEALQ